MSLAFNDKLLEIFTCIEASCNSSVRIFDRNKGHSNRAVGFAAYEERQQALKEVSERGSDVIEFLCKKHGHNYFKFEGRTIKIISSPRESLSKNVFDRNAFERDDDEFGGFDPLIRIIYKADYDLENNEVTILECYYLEIDRNTHNVVKEINILNLSKGKGGFIAEVASDKVKEVELPAGSLLAKTKVKNTTSNDND